ncbi:MAG: hypothetical protein NWS92_05275 [Crocinitomicaceae bacterium]|nr:hypothetical protein [Crocinitomicaceae bacterium]MDP4869076.1 hypothetical protein [Crocinitomicaceae bacterium]MDP5043260.1 hypothetical protein [Crocinitomicaceae bacterium]MDP5066446.1 hypothetical protein [Crocinitomicaceae bacterium]
MKRSIACLFLLFFTVSTTAQTTLDWEVFHPVKNTWLPFGEAGSVQDFLWKSGELPDPFVGENEALYQWIEEEQWHFRTKFFLQENYFNADTLVLDIPNMDTYAQLYLNGTLVKQTANFFVHYRIALAVKDLLCGYNTLEIRIESPVCHHHDSRDKYGFAFPMPNDTGKEKVASLSRKPQYHFGWDWAPRLVTMGFAYPITLSVQPKVSLDYLLVNTLSIDTARGAELQLKFKIDGSAGVLVGKSQYFGAFQWSGQTELVLNQYIENPQLWWPNGQGEQQLYHDTLRFYDANGQLVLAHPFRFGIRQATLEQNKDEWGTPFAFYINGRPVFAKGANVIPPGIFAGAQLDSAYLALVPQMKAANFNFVRIWGGGMYAPEVFMRACDEAGIMVWHDFMFACAMYPGDADFINLVIEEVSQQVPRLAAHPSLVYFNGNNEVEVAWKNWGFQVQYHLLEKEQREIEAAYVDLFQKVLPSQVQTITNSSIPYVHTSPLSNWGKDEYFDHGTMHYWGVWHGKDPLTDFATKIGRFNAEYGFQSFPEPSAIARFANEKEQTLHSAVMKAHQKSYVGNGMIEKHAKTYYGKAKDFETFIYYSQLTQRKAVSMAIAGHRANAPRSMGTIYWQLNDCWPAPTWSSLDDHNNWKALHYAVRDDYRSVAVMELHKDEARYIVLQSDLPTDTLVTVQVEFYNAAGLQTDVQRRTYPLSTYQTQVLFNVSEAYVGFVKVILDEQYTRTFTFIDKRKSKELSPQMRITEQDASSKKGLLTIVTTEPLVDLWLYSKTQELHFERNFETLLPGTHVLEFTYQDQLPVLGEITYLLR